MDARIAAFIPDTTELAERRLGAYGYLYSFLRSGDDRELRAFVAEVGEGGTFASDFWFASDGDERREALWPRCWHCWQRKHPRAFKPNPRLLHGRSPYCDTCRREREDERRSWHRQGSARVSNIIAIDEPRVYFKDCECCGKRYETVHADQRYCSKSCRWTVNKRNHRARKAG